MGYLNETAAATLVSGIQVRLTSMTITAGAATPVSAWATIYEATAATTGKEVGTMKAGVATKSVNWVIPGGVVLDSLFLVCNSAYVTLTWD